MMVHSPTRALPTSCKQHPAYPWCGPMIVWGMRGLGKDPSLMDDLDTTDFSMIVHYLFDYGDKNLDRHNVHIPKKVQGVLVNCDAEMRLFNKARYEVVDVPASNAIFRQCDTQRSQIAARVGTPLLARMTAPKQAWKKGSNDAQGIVMLHRQIQDDSKTINGLGWGWAPHYWLLCTSNVLVVRQDRKPLSVKELEGMCSWAMDVLHPRFQTVMEAGDEEEPSTAAKAALVASITRNDLQKYVKESEESSTMLARTSLDTSDDE